MKKPELYEKTVSILVDAYMNDTLEHGTCSACAVTNIIKHYIPNLNFSNVIEGWPEVFCTSWRPEAGGISQRFNFLRYRGEAKKQIDCTGYAVSELAKIEYAFETALKGASEDEYMFNGLMAVIDALDIIHNNVDTTLTTQSKSRFSKAI